jgi:hypothetical protein
VKLQLADDFYASKLRVAHASRVLAMASRHRELPFELKSQEKIVSARTLKPTRETRALPNPLLARVL